MSEILHPTPAPPIADWPDHWLRLYAEVGYRCQGCGGALGWHTRVTGEPPDMIISQGFRCLWCGVEL